eukprot:gene9843-10853_t
MLLHRYLVKDVKASAEEVIMIMSICQPMVIISICKALNLSVVSQVRQNTEAVFKPTIELIGSLTNVIGNELVRMKQRAFPESFWHEPEAMQTSSLAGGPYTVLFFRHYSPPDSMDITEIRPLTPPNQGGGREEASRPKKQIASDSLVHKQPSSKRDEDPYKVDSLSEKLFPQLSLGGSTPTNAAPKFAVLKLPTGERTIELPAIQQAPTNYSAMLSELASLL